jgi:adenosylcobinamide-phosphate synthase
MPERLIWQTAAIAAGFLIDYIVGDPYSIPHPVVAIGKLIDFFDSRLRRGNSNPADIGRGALTVVSVALVSTAVPALILWAAWLVHPVVYFVISSIMCWQILAARQLFREGLKVQRALEKGDVEGARSAVSMIVGRDTNVLDDKGICRAAVETVAENASDGVVAPLIFIALGGAPLGFFYKAINTMDSMIGYKNERYLDFGRAAAKLDDFVNYLPSRISARLMIFACHFLGSSFDAPEAERIYLRDRLKHASPNSAQTESVCAGALGIQLAGDASYFGKLVHKPTIGDAKRAIEPEDIRRANRLMYGAAILCLLICLIVMLLICYFGLGGKEMIEIMRITSA